MFELIILYVVFWDLVLWINIMFPIFINNIVVTVNSLSLLCSILQQNCTTVLFNHFHQWFLNFCYNGFCHNHS